MPKIKCTNCGSSNTKKLGRVIYGLVRPTPELKKQHHEGKIRYGGCNPMRPMPERICNECGTEFTRPVQRKRRPSDKVLEIEIGPE